MAKNDKRVEKLNEKIKAWFDYYADNIETYSANISFVQGSQWDPDTVAYYAANNKSIITYNILGKFIKQIVGEQLKTTPEMQVVVDTDQANQKKIALKQDLLRTIQIKNNAKECYEVAFECALSGGWGALWCYNDYESGLTFDQCVRQEPIKEPTLCWWDPKAKNKCKDDGDACGYISYFRKSDFKRKWPNAEPTSDNWDTQIIDPGFFVTESDDDELIAVSTSYEKRYFKKKIVMVSPTLSGEKSDTITKDKFDEYVEKYVSGIQQVNQMLGIGDQPVDAPKIVDERTVDDYKMKCTRHTKHEILEVYDFPSKELPLTYVDGYSYSDKGKQIVKSFVQDAHDAQRLLNYNISEQAQSVRTYRRETIYATNKMMNGAMQQGKNPEKGAFYFPVESDMSFNGGIPLFREQQPIPAALFEAVNSAKQAILDILGRTEAAMGDPGNEVSGVAIQNRMMQQNTVVNKWFDGLLKAIAQQGRCVNDLINNLYDQPREMMLYKEDNKAYKAKLNDYNMMTGDVDNEITDDDMEITISVGANYEMLRQEERKYLLDLMNASQNPLFAKVGDLLAGLSDTPIMPKVVERIKTIIDPAILAKEEGKPPPPPPPPPPQLMIEQQKLKNEEQANQIKAQQTEVDKIKAQVNLLLGVMGLQEKGIQADAEVKRAEAEFGKQLSKDNLDHVGHGVKALGHMKDLAALVQQPSPQQESNAGMQT